VTAKSSNDAPRAGAPPPARLDGDRLLRTCPNCGAALAERKCKLLCPNLQCGYFLSCADYY